MAAHEKAKETAENARRGFSEAKRAYEGTKASEGKAATKQARGFASRRSSEKEHKVNALALGAEEGRDKLRKAACRSKYPIKRRSPNGATHA